MKIGSRLAIALALGGVVVAGPLAAKDKEPKGAASKYTPAVATGYNAAKKALDAGDTAAATSQYQALKGQVQTDDDKFVIGQLGVSIGQKVNDNALTSEGVDMMLASGKANPAQISQLAMAQGKFAYQAKDYRKAETAFLQAQQAGAKDDQLVPLLVSSMQFNGETVKALTTLNAAIDANVAAGQPTPNEWFARGLDIGYRAKPGTPDQPQIIDLTTQITRKWVTGYPTKGNWHDALMTYLTQSKADRDLQIDIFRMLRAAGALSGDADYREYADDVYLKYPNEAKSVLEEGISKGVVNTNNKDAQEILGIVKPKLAADQASLAASDKTSRAAANGKAALALADAYAGYGQYAKAIDLYKVAMQKGGVDEPTVALRMGWAMALSGDTAGAKTQFATVGGTRKPLAEFWITHLDHPTQG